MPEPTKSVPAPYKKISFLQYDVAHNRKLLKQKTDPICSNLFVPEDHNVPKDWQILIQ